MEHYKTIEKYPKYEVSDLGNVRNKRTGVVRKLTNRGGYLKLRLSDIDENVHRLVAETFLDHSIERTQVNHIDGDKTNNRVDNLEWVSPSKNVKHAYDTGLKRPSGGLPPRKVVDKTTGCVYESMKDCSRIIGGTHQGVMYALSHNHIYTGHDLEFYEEDIE